VNRPACINIPMDIPGRRRQIRRVVEGLGEGEIGVGVADEVVPRRIRPFEPYFSLTCSLIFEVGSHAGSRLTQDSLATGKVD
jgi:hypothetical protein